MRPRKGLGIVERSRKQSAENAAYRLQVGDGVTPMQNGNRPGVIERIEGGFAYVRWLIGESRERETVALAKLEYYPMMEKIKAECEQIQSEWDEADERHRNNYPSPEIQPVAKLSNCHKGPLHAKQYDESNN